MKDIDLGIENACLAFIPKDEEDDAKIYCKKHVVEILSLMPDSVGGYICPICGSGSGPHGTGLTTQDGIHWRCWVEGESYDVFSLAEKLVETGSLKVEGRNIFEKVYRLAGLLDMTSDERVALYTNESPITVVERTNATLIPTKLHNPVNLQVPEYIPDYSENYREAELDLFSTKGNFSREYMHQRGISDETLQRFHIGYAFPKYCRRLRVPKEKADDSMADYPVYEGWVDTTNGKGAILIPVSRDCYVLRNLNKESTHRYAKITVKGNPFKVINADIVKQKPSAIFIVEGYVDFLSVEEVGFQALAIGTTGVPRELQALLFTAYENHSLDETLLVICEDNDSAGQTGLAKIKKFLAGLPGIHYCCCDPCKGITDSQGNSLKDANDALINDREQFKRNLEEALTSPEIVTVSASNKIETITQVPQSAIAEDAEQTLLKGTDTVPRDNDEFVADMFCPSEEISFSSSPPVISKTECTMPSSKTASANSKTVLQPVASFLKDFLTMDGSRYIPISTGIPELDEVLGGGLIVGLYGLQGPSGFGKSTLALQICDNIASRGITVLYVSLEMGINDLISKSLARLMYKNKESSVSLLASDTNNNKSSTDILMRSVHYDNWSPEDKTAFAKAINEYAEIAKNMFIVEGGMVASLDAVHTTDRIEACMIDIHASTGQYPIVCVDYIQKLKGATVSSQLKTLTEKQIIDESIFNLRQLTSKYSVPIIGILSMNRQSYGQGVSLGSSKGSGDIEYTCDVLLGLDKSRDSSANDENEASIRKGLPRDVDIKVNKNRYGMRNISATLQFYAKECYFGGASSIYNLDNDFHSLLASMTSRVITDVHI